MRRVALRLGGRGGDVPLGLILLTGAIAIAVVSPLVWLVLAASAVDPARGWELLVRDSTREVLLDSLLLMLGVTAAGVIVGVPLAVLTTLTDLPYRRLWTVLVALPLVVPSYVGAFAVVSAFGPRGRFVDLLEPLGVTELPSIYGLRGAILIISMYTYPYVFLTTRAALIAFDERLLDAARSLNHGQARAIWQVAIPQVRPAVAAGALLSALYALSDFGTPAIMRASVFTREIYLELRSLGHDYAAILSLELLALVVLVLILERSVRPEAGRGSQVRRAAGRPISLGRWRWPAVLAPLTVVTVSLGIPLWILLAWLVDPGTARRSSLAFEWSFAMNSVLVAVVTALVAAAAAVPVAYLARRHGGLLPDILERVTYLGFAVPGIVLGFALVYLGANVAPVVYPTLGLLTFAYVVRFLPQAVSALGGSAVQVDARLIEAAGTLGASRLRVFRRVTLPMLAPGVVAGGALVFLTTMKELPITLLLRPRGFETIVTQIWRAQEQGFYQYAAVPAILLIGISGLSMLVLLAQEGSAKT
ncbi:MAG: ABC transporter permease [Halobacteriales archaeon]